MKEIKLIEVEPTNGCNLKCSICQHGKPDPVNFPHYPAQKCEYLSPSKFERILTKFDYPVPTVQFCGTGEPLLHPRLDHLIASARKFTNNVELVTNGLLLTSQSYARKLERAGLTLLRVSIDGATPDMYKTMRGANLNSVIRNVKQFTETTDVKVMVSYVVVKENVADALLTPELATKMGASILELRLFDGGSANNSQFAIGKNTSTLHEIIQRKCSQRKLELRLWEFRDYNTRPCLLETEVHINYRGNLTPCYHRPRFSLNKNLETTPFSTIWASKRLRNLKTQIKSRDFPTECKCIRTQKPLGNKNKNETNKSSSN